MRGKENGIDFFESHHRITPAYAGKRFRSNATGTLDRDHPRICGEKTKKIP